jgi:hypothetical protein
VPHGRSKLCTHQRTVVGLAEGRSPCTDLVPCSSIDKALELVQRPQLLVQPRPGSPRQGGARRSGRARSGRWRRAHPQGGRPTGGARRAPCTAVAGLKRGRCGVLMLPTMSDHCT